MSTRLSKVWDAVQFLGLAVLAGVLCGFGFASAILLIGWVW